MRSNYLTYERAFEKFKINSNEKTLLGNIISSQIDFKPSTTILDVGSFDGVIVKKLQPNHKNITLVDVIDHNEPVAKYIKKPFEEVVLKSNYDVSIAMHVWGHFYKNNSSAVVLDKMIKHTNDCVVVCYNTNSGFMEELINLVPNLTPESQFKLSDYNSIKNKISSEKNFSVDINADSFEDLTNLTRILFANNDDEYNSKFEIIKNFYQNNLYTPKLVVEQKMLFIGEKK